MGLIDFLNDTMIGISQLTRIDLGSIACICVRFAVQAGERYVENRVHKSNVFFGKNTDCSLDSLDEAPNMPLV